MSINEQFIIEKIIMEANQLKNTDKNIENLIRMKAYCDLLLESGQMAPVIERADKVRVKDEKRVVKEDSNSSLLDF